MTPQFPKLNQPGAGVVPSLCTARCLSAHQLTEENKIEVLQFLAQRPVHTAVMSGFIRDNGLESAFNRGRFYACRDEMGSLEGVTLIGHSMFLEARSNDALREFARLAQEFRRPHMIMGEQEMIARFWSYYNAGGQAPRRIGREILFELNQRPETFVSVPNLRLANLDDLSLVMPVHATMAFEESGVNPLLTDPNGFRMRCRRRIQQDRVWVWIESGRLIFKADVISDTPDVIYLEGIYVDPNERGKGYGSSCIAQMSSHLLRRTKSIIVLVNEGNRQARKFFQHAGFTSRALYDTIFLQD